MTYDEPSERQLILYALEHARDLFQLRAEQAHENLDYSAEFDYGDARAIEQAMQIVANGEMPKNQRDAVLEIVKEHLPLGNSTRIQIEQVLSEHSIMMLPSYVAHGSIPVDAKLPGYIVIPTTLFRGLMQRYYMWCTTGKGDPDEIERDIEKTFNEGVAHHTAALALNESRFKLLNALRHELLWIWSECWPLIHDLTSRDTVRARFKKLPDLINRSAE